MGLIGFRVKFDIDLCPAVAFQGFRRQRLCCIGPKFAGSTEIAHTLQLFSVIELYQLKGDPAEPLDFADDVRWVWLSDAVGADDETSVLRKAFEDSAL